MTRANLNPYPAAYPAGSSSPESASPVVSVITVVRNDIKELARILVHIAPFREDGRVELIVVDGASTDGSVEVLEALPHRVDRWISEPDKGIYDAMNKGIALAQGRYVTHINAGDTLLAIPWEQLRDHPDGPGWVSCSVREDGGLFLPRLSWLSRFANTLHHQGTFVRRDLHLGYKTDYRVYADFEHHQRLLRAGVRPLLLPDFLAAEHASGGISADQRWVHEEARSVRENFGFFHSLVPRIMVPVRHYRSLLYGRFAALSAKSKPGAQTEPISVESSSDRAA